MMMLGREILSLIIKPSLIACGLYSKAWCALIYATGLTETNYLYLKQMGNVRNGGLGFFQEEPSDHADIKKWLRNPVNKALEDRILSACYMQSMPVDDNVIMWDIRYATILCRLHYYRIKETTPDIDHPSEMCQYYVKYYNGGGKASMEKCIWAFQQACTMGDDL